MPEGHQKLKKGPEGAWPLFNFFEGRGGGALLITINKGQTYIYFEEGAGPVKK